MDIPLKYKQLWSNWDVRVLILLSLFIQIILIFLGRMRRIYTSRWVQFIVWGNYQLADWVAAFVLGKLSDNMDDSSSSVIIAFWAPFLILHLGGPDTITAYSMEDNELWARHLLGLCYEISVAFYVLFRSLPNTRLLAPTLLIFFVAIIKYVERSYSLYKASIEAFRNSIGSFNKVFPIKDLNALSHAFWLYSYTKVSFLDLIPHQEEDTKIRDLLYNMTPEELMRIMSTELNYAYDEFYTKAIINYSKIGYVLRVICSICILLAFLLFVLAPKNDFKNIDIAITYVLLIASICLDVVAGIMLVFSDRMVVSLLNVKKLSNWSGLLAKYIIRIKTVCHKRRYYPIKLPQMNLLINCLRISIPNKAPRERIINWFKKKLGLVQEIELPLSGDSLNQETYTLQTTQPVQATKEIMEIIAFYLQRNWDMSMEELSKPAGLSALRKVIDINDRAIPTFIQLFEGMLLDHQVMVWHIATDLCFHCNPEFQHLLHPHQIEVEIENNISVAKEKSSKMKTCMYLSNYMMHMMVMRSDIMSTTRVESSFLFWGAIDEMVHFIREIVNSHHNLLMQNARVEKACMEMTTFPINWDRCQSLFAVAQVVVRLMLVIKEEERWEVMTTVWVELLMKGAKNSRANVHVKQLTMGDEPLSFIWLFNKHMGMFEKFIPTLVTFADYIEKAQNLYSEIERHLN